MKIKLLLILSLVICVVILLFIQEKDQKSLIQFRSDANQMYTLSDIVMRLGEDLEKEEISDSSKTWFERNRVPMYVLNVLECNCYSNAIEIGSVYFYNINSVPEINNELELIENGYLGIGSSPNGDVIAVNLNTGKIAFVSHDLLWEKQYTDVSETVAQMDLSIDEFFVQSFYDDDFPVDYWEATNNLNVVSTSNDTNTKVALLKNRDQIEGIGVGGICNGEDKQNMLRYLNDIEEEADKYLRDSSKGMNRGHRQHENRRHR